MKSYTFKLGVLLLVLSMLLSSFAGCKKKENTDPIETIYLTVPAESDEECLAVADKIEEKLLNIGYTVTRKTDDEEEVSKGAYEIRFGQLSYKKSKALLEKIGSYGWAIQKDGTKLYLTATDSRFLSIAVETFEKDVFTTRTNPFEQMTDTVKSFDNEMLYLFNGGASKMTIRGDFTESEIKTAADRMISNLRVLTGVEVSKKGEEEIAVELALEKYGDDLPYYNSYTIKSEENKILISAGSLKGLIMAINDFYDFTKNLVSFADTQNVCFPENVKWSSIVDDKVPMLPVLNKATAYGGAVEGSYVMAAENVKYQDYLDYVALIEAEGYVLQEERVLDFDYIEGDTLCYTPNHNGEADNSRQNTFRTYTNSKYMVYVYFCEGTSTIRLIGSGLDQYNAYVDAKNQEAAPSTNSFIAMLDIGAQNTSNEAWIYPSGMCYVIKLNDGRFIVIDGGLWDYSDTYASDVKRLYNWLKSKSDDGRIVIAAWLLTHAHSDHVSVAWKFNQDYRNDENVEIQRYMFNFPTYAYAQPIAQNTLTTSYYDKWYPRIMSMVNSKNPTVVHTGQSYQFANCTVDILFTQEDFYPRSITAFNNTSTIFKLTIEGKTFLVVGDLQEPGQSRAAIQNGTLLDSDYFQVAHHGTNGDMIFHKYVLNGKPTEVLHPRHEPVFNTENKAIVWLIENAAKIYTADKGIVELPLS